MNSSIILKISHISGLPHQNDVTITLHRDALLDHEYFEQHLTSAQFTWLANARCTVRCCDTGIASSWWLQHGSHQYTCSINDQRIACSDSIQLQTGDRIEIGMLRLEVMDITHQQQTSLSPALPLASASIVAPVAAEVVTADESMTDDDIFGDLQTLAADNNTIPLLTDIVEPTEPVYVAQADDDVADNSDDALICIDDIQQALFNIVPAYTPVDESVRDDDILAQLEQQYETTLHQPQQITASAWASADVSASSSVTTAFEHDLTLSDLENNACISDDVSLEEALLGTLSIHQALAHLQTDEEDEDDIISAAPEFDSTEHHASTDVLALFADTTITPKNNLSTQHIHQSFPDSFCDIGTETVSFDVDTITQETR